MVGADGHSPFLVWMRFRETTVGLQECSLVDSFIGERDHVRVANHSDVSSGVEFLVFFLPYLVDEAQQRLLFVSQAYESSDRWKISIDKRRGAIKRVDIN